MQTHNQRIGAFLMTLLFAGVAVTMLVTAYSYSRASGMLPRFAGWIFVCLALIEVLIQLKMLIAARRGPRETTQATTEVQEHEQWIRGVKGLFWLALVLVAIYLVGFLIATPLYVFAFLWISARSSVARSGIVAASVTAFVYLVFVRALEYKLYAGVLFQ